VDDEDVHLGRGSEDGVDDGDAVVLLVVRRDANDGAIGLSVLGHKYLAISSATARAGAGPPGGRRPVRSDSIPVSWSVRAAPSSSSASISDAIRSGDASRWR